jgi:hypothetical protein
MWCADAQVRLGVIEAQQRHVISGWWTEMILTARVNLFIPGSDSKNLSALELSWGSEFSGISQEGIFCFLHGEFGGRYHRCSTSEAVKFPVLGF